MFQERRRVPRYRLDAEIAVDDSNGRTIDLSANGVYFETARALTIGDQVSLVLPFEQLLPGTTVRCTGRVIRVDPRGELFGVAATYEPVAFTVPG